MDKSERDVAREYERQMEKLDLLAKELQIQRDEKALKSKSGEMNALKNYLKTITDDIDALAKTRDHSRKGSPGWMSCLGLRRTAQQTLESRGVYSKMKKKLADKLEVEKKTSKTLKTIRELKVSLSAARTIFEGAKNSYQSRWGEEQCCRVNRVELSNIVNQLALSKKETEATKEELNTLKELFRNCKEQKLQQANILERVEMKLQAANQRLDKQSKEFKDIRTYLRNAYQDIAKMLSDDGIREELILASQNTPPNAPPEAIVPRMSSTSAPISKSLEGLTDVTDLIADLTQHVEKRRNIIFKALRGSEIEVQGSIRDVQGYQSKIDQMMPLYKVGVDTRQRKYELDMKDINHSRPDWELVNKGNEAAHSGRALADAMLFHQLCTETRSHRYPGEFEDQYNKVPAKVVWEHQDFTIFHDILSWHMDMRQFGSTYKNKQFDEDFEFLFSKIYPSFEIGSNEAIQKDPKLQAAYVNLCLNHAEANRQVKARRRERRDF
jgi:hypothetical protein